jgi:hypothetical protein
MGEQPIVRFVPRLAVSALTQLKALTQKSKKLSLAFPPIVLRTKDLKILTPLIPSEPYRQHMVDLQQVI